MYWIEIISKLKGVGTRVLDYVWLVLLAKSFMFWVDIVVTVRDYVSDVNNGKKFLV